MKKVLTLFVAGMMALAVSAQNTKIVKGSVLDKNGKPVAGAKVAATGGAVYTVVKEDGTYSLEVPIWLKSLTATCPGMTEKKMKVKDGDIDFKLRKQTSWFVNVEGACILGDETDFGVGLRMGYLGNWGGYAKVVVPMASNYDESHAIPSVSAGVTKKLLGGLYGYLGAGFSPVYYNDVVRFGDYSYETSRNAQGGIFEAGFMVKVNRFNLGVGYGISSTFGDNTNQNHSVQFGLGYVF